MNKTGTVFVVEGIDSSGKSTLCGKLKEYLANEGVPVEVYHFPGKGMNTLGGLVYKIHHNEYMFDEKIPPLSLQTLHVAAHIDLWLNYINDAVSKGTVVILDRFWWSTYAYGRRQSIDEHVLWSLIDVEKSCYSPEIIRHYFYLYRESSGDHDPLLHEYYMELTRMKEFAGKTTVINSDFEKDNAFSVALEIMRRSIGGF